MESRNGVPKWGPTWGPKWDPKMGSKMGSLILGGSPKWSLRRRFCFDTLDGRGPRSARGPPELFSQWSPNWDPKMGSKMGSKNGVQITVLNGLQNWGPNWDPNMGLPSLRTATTTNKNEKSPLSVSSGSGCWPLGGSVWGGN